MLAEAINKARSGLGCRTLENLQYNQSAFSVFPGYSKNYDGYKTLG